MAHTPLFVSSVAVTLTLSLGVAAASGQQPPSPPAPVPAVAAATAPPLTGKSFLPAEHRTLVAVDLKGLRDRGVMEAIEDSLLGSVLPRLEQQAGFPLANLDRLWAYADIDGERTSRNLYVFEGNAALQPPPLRPGQQVEHREVGRYRVDCSQDARGELWIAQPRPELLVVGHPAFVEGPLLGKPSNGLPAADVLSLLSGRGDNLIYGVIDIGQSDFLRQVTLGRLLQVETWPQDDLPLFLMARARTIGDADDPHLEVELVVRFATGKAGVEQGAAAMRQLFVRLQEDKQLGALKKLWQSVEVTVDGRDLAAKKDLGRLRDSVGTLAVLLGPVLRG